MSSAVMASRISDPKAFDFFCTPPWATRAVVREVLQREGLLEDGPPTVVDPCCGAGHMAIPLSESFADVIATDIHDWGYGQHRDLDFTMATRDSFDRRVGWVIANPPFIHAERFLDRALDVAETGVAFLLRLAWIEGQDRHRDIFGGKRRPVLLCPFAERVPMVEGCWDPEAKSATAYAWFIWTKETLRHEAAGFRRTEVLHIPPGMELRYTRSSDEALANRGEAARRRAAKKAAEAT